MDRGLSQQMNRVPHRYEGDEKVIKTILDHVEGPRKKALQEIIDAAEENGDRELIAMLFNLCTLKDKRAELYEKQKMAADEKEKNDLNNQLLAAWEKILDKAEEIDNKISRNSTESIIETLRIRK